jgi:hypothetical protein
MTDPVLANVCARLAARNADLMLVHPESEGDGWGIAWSTERGAMSDRLRIGNRTIHLSDIDSCISDRWAAVRHRLLASG